MKNLVISCFLIVFQTISINAQDLNKVYFDKSINRDVLIDRCTIEGLKGPIFGEFFEAEYKNYISNKSIIKKLSAKDQNFKIKIVLGTWCHDSKMQVPRFIKILDEIEFNEKNLEIICVDRAKKTHAFSIEDLSVKYVPTFIFYKEDKEIGRIIESPEISLEEDFLMVLN